MLQILRILEEFDLPKLGHNSVDYIHTIAETIKLAFADRETFYGDPDFVGVPIEQLLSGDFASKRLH